ncbi:membrane-bound O-acyltransferase family protein [Salipaludibacillus neizhouensis]|uniref:Membrane-bound O-acyltransferase family protein n=1 Tax=Salipaludibacillus neizhouensis TaxID=885475 RepID=A0A3A9K9D4_9BACI|nr:MBOAT family O-acyltransferase [Salipaludibacillus neizhouensis]RKL68138.1 membrane-bound O-acyltransferase family protein [Salipaludibacillus neizhouensis]
MLFNSFEFIFIFLPFVFFVYMFLNKRKLTILAKVWLVLSSLFFYSWWNVLYLPLILSSMIINYLIGKKLGKTDSLNSSRKPILIIGIVLNVGLLGYYKYSDFFIENVNYFFSTNIPLLNLVLPLAISFFTFQQISYLVDAYRNETKEYDFLNYALFVSFFPQLIAGPIVHHKEMMPQFESKRNKFINYRNIALGILIFSIGLFKKVAIADTFALWATEGFDNTEVLTFFEGWIVSLSYTFQIYFDFSGYTDMAIGIALLFNILLPINFNSPYKALSIQDFWKRWHITLSRFLTHYIYIPLGGSRKGKRRTYINIFLIFLISGFWHGAGWTFVFWGSLHGIAMVVNRYWQTLNIKMNVVLAWFITFNFVNLAWVPFRAETWGDAVKVWSGMFGLNGFNLPIIGVVDGNLNFVVDYLLQYDLLFTNNIAVVYIFIFGLVSVLVKNSMEFSNTNILNWKYVSFTALILTYAILNLSKLSEFLYFNF